MSIEFKGSSSAFISTIVERLDTRKLTKGQELSVGIPTKSVSRLLDLFTTGRLLSFLTQLRNEFSIPTEFVFATPRSSQKRIIRDLEYLFSMDFLKICGELGISIKQPQTSQPLLGDELEESSYFSRGKIEKGIFRSCLIPLQLCPFDASVRGSEAATAKEVSRLVGIFTDSIDKRLFRVGYSGDQPNLELSRLLFVFLTEMISNSISHSGSSQLLIGMTLSREFGDEFSAHRHGISLEAGQPKFELLVMDWGQGIFNSFAETLNGETISPLGSEYFSLKKWQPEYRLFRTQEQSTLLNIFRGDLVIRKGRKSEGLHELGRSLQWFGGLLNLYTGRCELLISAAGSESPRTAHRNFASPFYLPGVIASVVLPSYELKVIAAKSAAITESVGDGSLERNQLCEIRRLRCFDIVTNRHYKDDHRSGREETKWPF